MEPKATVDTAKDAVLMNGEPNGQCATAVAHIQDVPEWICKRLNCPSMSVHVLQIPSEAEKLYNYFINYLGTHAVNVPRNVEVTDDEVEGLTRRLLKQTKWGDEEIEKAQLKSFRRRKEEIDPRKYPKPVFALATGVAQVKVNDDEIVYVAHEKVGEAVGTQNFPKTPHMVNCYAKMKQTLDDLTDSVIIFNLPPPVKPKSPPPGKYKLLTLEVHEGNGIWIRQGTRNARSIESIILPKGMRDEILADFNDFAADDTKEWYLSRGLPYRRSYLFYGPPGTGKTSTIRALAGVMDLPACFISLGNIQIGNKQLLDGLSGLPKPSMIVIEDIDSLFNERRKAETAMALTFSGLLNALDGLISAEGIVCVMTTNHIERLDPALIRAGRVDRRFEFEAPTHEQIEALFQSFYKDAEEALAKEFADRVFARKEKEARSIATLQEHFIFTRRKSARECIDMLPKFFTEFYPTSFGNNQTYYM